MLFLTAIYEEMSLSYSVLGLTEKECRAVMNEKIAAAALLCKKTSGSALPKEACERPDLRLSVGKNPINNKCL